MKKNFLILILLFFLIFNFCSYKQNKISSKIYLKENKLVEIKEEHKINIHYPITRFDKLNIEIKKLINTTINDFKLTISNDSIQHTQYYTLYILYEEYSFKNFISYAFIIEDYTGGAHPNHNIKTINYDSINDRIISIDTLLFINPSILKKFSKISRDTLLNLNEYKEVEDMVKDGTVPIKDNFENFVFTENGIRLLFNYYQVGPYYYGYKDVTIPYDVLNINILFN